MYKEYNASKLLCPESYENLALVGSSYSLSSNIVKQITLSLEPCIGYPFCDDSVTDLLDTTAFQLIMTNYYFDGSDLENPVKFKFQSSSIQRPANNYEIKQTLFTSENTVQTDQNYFSLLGDTKTKRYLSAERGTSEATTYNGYKNTFEFTVSEKEKLQTVSSLNVFDMVGLAGGLNSILTLV